MQPRCRSSRTWRSRTRLGAERGKPQALRSAPRQSWASLRADQPRGCSTLFRRGGTSRVPVRGGLGPAQGVGNREGRLARSRTSRLATVAKHYPLRSATRYKTKSRRADSNRLPLLQLRVITHALQGSARACGYRIPRPLSLLRFAACCTVLRSRWYQSGINIASTLYLRCKGTA